MAKKYNCEKNGIKYFRKTKTIGHDFNGKPIKKEFYGDGEKDADKQIEEYMEKLKSGLDMNVSELTIEQGMYQWLFDVLLYSKNIKSASFEKYERHYRTYIKEQKIGCINIQEINSHQFQTYYNELYKKGIYIYNKQTNKKELKAVSSNMIFDLNKTLRAFFSYCVKQHYILNNPCTLSNIDIPGNADGDDDYENFEGNDIQAFNDEELKLIIDNLKYKKGKDNTFNIMILLDIVTGLRHGELRGLKKKFLTKHMVRIRNTLNYIKVYDTPTEWHRELKLTKPKSEPSIRDVNIPTNIYPILEKYLEEQDLKWKSQGLIFNDDCLLFTTSSCLPIENGNFRKAWQRFLKRIKIDYKKPHAIRDTYATNLIRKGASITTVKALLGHSSTKITEKYYIYVFPEDKSETANLMNDLII